MSRAERVGTGNEERTISWGAFNALLFVPWALISLSRHSAEIRMNMMRPLIWFVTASQDIPQFYEPHTHSLPRHWHRALNDEQQGPFIAAFENEVYKPPNGRCCSQVSPSHIHHITMYKLFLALALLPVLVSASPLPLPRIDEIVCCNGKFSLLPLRLIGCSTHAP